MPTSRSAPPPRALFSSRSFGFHAMRPPKSAFSIRTSPMEPEAIHSRTRSVTGSQRVHIASMKKRFRARASATIAPASRAFIARGFSHRTGFPARSAARTFPQWAGWGVPT